MVQRHLHHSTNYDYKAVDKEIEEQILESIRRYRMYPEAGRALITEFLKMVPDEVRDDIIRMKKK